MYSRRLLLSYVFFSWFQMSLVRGRPPARSLIYGWHLWEVVYQRLQASMRRASIVRSQSLRYAGPSSLLLSFIPYGE